MGFEPRVFTFLLSGFVFALERAKNFLLSGHAGGIERAKKPSGITTIKLKAGKSND